MTLKGDCSTDFRLELEFRVQKRTSWNMAIDIVDNAYISEAN